MEGRGRAELRPLLLLPAFAVMKIETLLLPQIPGTVKTGARGALREGLAVSQHRGSLDSQARTQLPCLHGIQSGLTHIAV